MPLVARTGGDEFTVIVPDVDAAGVAGPDGVECVEEHGSVLVVVERDLRRCGDLAAQGSCRPLLLAFGLLPAPAAHNLLLFLHGLAGLLFCFLWARSLGLSGTAAAGVGLAAWTVMTTRIAASQRASGR